MPTTTRLARLFSFMTIIVTLLTSHRCRGSDTTPNLWKTYQSVFHDPDIDDDQCLQFSSTWTHLGPFQTGTREAEWGADPLEKYGGFRNLSYDYSAVFRSSLTQNGTTSWNYLSDVNVQGSSVKLVISHDDLDWDIMRSTYGWAGMQFQGWVRGTLKVSSERCEKDSDDDDDSMTIVVRVENVLEIWVDNTQYFGGDVYAYGRAAIVLHLAPGNHQIDLRVLNDIRMFGGRMPPKVELKIFATLSTSSLVALKSHAVVPDIVGGAMVSSWASIPVRNEGKKWIEIVRVNMGSINTDSDLYLLKRFFLAPGQSRPMKFKLASKAISEAGDVFLNVQYKKGGLEELCSLAIELKLKVSKELMLPHKFTYTHPSGIISYGIIQPPSQERPCRNRQKVPILLSFHGAGVDTDSDMSRNGYRSLSNLCAWILIPSGVTPWSGDDWHNWGLADAEAAVAAIPVWNEAVKWKGQDSDPKRWFISGHSNGGQGAWYALIHRSGNVIGGAPISGYLSISSYVPYVMWAESDPRAMAVLMSSMNSFKHEILAENLAGVPIIQMHGGADDNVPVYHSRHMFMLLGEAASENNLNHSVYHELPRKPHWFDGILTYGELGTFLVEFFENDPQLVTMPKEFSVVVANPGDMGCRGGICVDQLRDSGSLGRMDISVEKNEHTRVWKIFTTNIRRWHFSDQPGIGDVLEIDGQILGATTYTLPYIFSRSDKSATWTRHHNCDFPRNERYGLQLGTMAAILNSRGPFIIVSERGDPLHPHHETLSLDISRNLFQYLGADTEISSSLDDIKNMAGNVIFVGIPDSIIAPNFPISLGMDGDLILRTSNGRRRSYKIMPGLGCIFLFPLSNQRVGLVIWGADILGLRNAARLVPIRTGVGQPDFVLLGPKSGWKGLGGVLAMGTFDSNWDISESSYLT